MPKIILPPPKSHEQEVLFDLIEKGKASIETFYWMAGFRTRVSQLILQRGIFLQRIPKKHISKHGNTTTYYVHILPKNQKKKAIQTYINLNNYKK